MFKELGSPWVLFKSLSFRWDSPTDLELIGSAGSKCIELLKNRTEARSLEKVPRRIIEKENVHLMAINFSFNFNLEILGY